MSSLGTGHASRYVHIATTSSLKSTLFGCRLALWGCGILSVRDIPHGDSSLSQMKWNDDISVQVLTRFSYAPSTFPGITAVASYSTD